MRRAALVGALLAAGVALAAGGLGAGGLQPSVVPPGVSPSSTPNIVQASTGEIVEYVSSLGSDDNDCLSWETACATHQRALARLPKFLRFPVRLETAGNIDGGVQTYPCLVISGFTEDVSDGGRAGFFFDGGLALHTSDGGVLSASGVASSVSNGSGVTWPTFTDNTQDHPTNVYQGYFLEITSGTGAGQVKTISSNTSTAFTLMETWGTPPTAGSGYAVRKPNVVINTNCIMPATPSSSASASLSSGAVVIANNNIGGFGRSGLVTMNNWGFANSEGAGVQVLDSTQFTGNRLRGSGMARSLVSGGNGGSIGTTGRVVLQEASWTGSTTAWAVSALGIPVSYSLNRVLSYGSNAGLFTASATLGGGLISITSCEAYNATTAGLLIASTPTAMQSISSSHFDCASSAGYGIIAGAFGTSGVTSFASQRSAALLGVSTNVFGSTCGTGIAAVGWGTVVQENGNTGTPATRGYAINWGGIVYNTAGTPLTGGTNDISIDQGAFVAQHGNINTSSCALADAGVSAYGSRFCK